MNNSAIVKREKSTTSANNVHIKNEEEVICSPEMPEMDDDLINSSRCTVIKTERVHSRAYERSRIAKRQVDSIDCSPIPPRIIRAGFLADHTYCRSEEETGENPLIGEDSDTESVTFTEEESRRCRSIYERCYSGPGASTSKGTNSKENIFLCYLCYHSTVCKSALIDHIMAEHINGRPYTCTHCDYAASQRATLENHILSKHTREKPFICTSCDYATARHSALKRHIMFKHTHEKPFSCPHCDYCASQRSDLKNHIIVKHTHEKPFSCPLCKYSVSHRSLLKHHIIQYHTNQKSYICPHCDYDATHSAALKNHIKSKHTHEKPLTCLHCIYEVS